MVRCRSCIVTAAVERPGAVLVGLVPSCCVELRLGTILPRAADAEGAAVGRSATSAGGLLGAARHVSAGEFVLPCLLAARNVKGISAEIEALSVFREHRAKMLDLAGVGVSL